jgi:hypothetical protein
MYRHSQIRFEGNVQPEQCRLTENNLRAHTLQVRCELLVSVMFYQTSGWCYQYAFDRDESEDEDLDDSRRDIALRKAASLEALQAYGGCFVSGFLAMQESLPRSPRTSKLGVFRQRMRLSNPRDSVMDVATITSYDSEDSPRPDSDTLSVADIRKLRTERRWSWRSMGRQRQTVARR